MPASDLTATPLEQFCAVLQDGLHLAAQPVTLLQAALSRECTAMLTEAELREIADTSAVESTRAARLFRILGQLVECYRTAPALEPVDLTRLVTDGVRAQAQANQYTKFGASPETQSQAEPHESCRLAGDTSGGLPLVDADEQATTELLRILLEAMHAVAGSEDTTLLSCKRVGASVQLSLSSGNSLLRGAGELRLALKLAGAVMERQGGTANWQTSPFVLDLVFNLSEKEKTSHE